MKSILLPFGFATCVFLGVPFASAYTVDDYNNQLSSLISRADGVGLFAEARWSILPELQNLPATADGFAKLDSAQDDAIAVGRDANLTEHSSLNDAVKQFTSAFGCESQVNDLISVEIKEVFAEATMSLSVCGGDLIVDGKCITPEVYQKHYKDTKPIADKINSLKASINTAKGQLDSCAYRSLR
jgi:hypothetical protein